MVEVFLDPSTREAVERAERMLAGMPGGFEKALRSVVFKIRGEYNNFVTGVHNSHKCCHHSFGATYCAEHVFIRIKIYPHKH